MESSQQQNEPDIFKPLKKIKNRNIQLMLKQLQRSPLRSHPSLPPTTTAQTSKAKPSIDKLPDLKQH